MIINNIFKKIKHESVAIILIGSILLCYLGHFSYLNLSKPKTIEQISVFTITRELPAKNIINKTIETVPKVPPQVPIIITPPQIMVKVFPVYPSDAILKENEGIVLLSVLIGETGRINDIKQIQSSGSRILDQSAAKAISQWQFVPAKQGMKNISARVEIPFNFKLLSEGN